MSGRVGVASLSQTWPVADGRMVWLSAPGLVESRRTSQVNRPLIHPNSCPSYERKCAASALSPLPDLNRPSRCVDPACVCVLPVHFLVVLLTLFLKYFSAKAF